MSFGDYQVREESFLARRLESMCLCLESVSRTLAERTVKSSDGSGDVQSSSFEWLRESQRGRMARTLENLLKIARGQARRRDSGGQDRLKWVNSICYIVQTYNSLLRDTNYDELRAEVTRLQEKVKQLNTERYQRPQTDPGTSQPETGKPEPSAEPAEPS